MYVKLPPGDLNLGPYPPHPTNTYTYGVTTAPRMRGGKNSFIIIIIIIFTLKTCLEIYSYSEFFFFFFFPINGLFGLREKERE